MDWTTAYFFRGIKQETEDLILQPYGELGVKLVDQAGALTSLTVTGGIWNSLQTGPTGLGQRDRRRIRRSGTSSTATSGSRPSFEDLTTYASTRPT